MKVIFIIFLSIGNITAQEYSLKKALKGWTAYGYDVKSGWTTKNTLLVPNKIGCSGFVSIIYYRMTFGDNWKNKFNFTPQQKYGDKAANLYGFKFLGKKDMANWASSPPLEKGLYFFNVRKDAHGHVGFIEVQSNGVWLQHHYSGMNSYKGYADGRFTEWHTNSMYKKENVEIYRVTFKSK